MGRDHTIFSLVSGYVKYYKDPKKHPKRQYIGVVFDKADALPYPPHAARKRKLGMTASPMPPPVPMGINAWFVYLCRSNLCTSQPSSLNAESSRDLHLYTDKLVVAPRFGG